MVNFSLSKFKIQDNLVASFSRVYSLFALNMGRRSFFIMALFKISTTIHCAFAYFVFEVPLVYVAVFRMN